ncbi:MAG TPA: spore photoproduct lyase [Clostridia bacterium]|nr:spore photoproduct lyase [Clostridia bacterium]
MPFEPKRVLFEQDALRYPLGQKLFDQFNKKAVEISILKSHNKVTVIPGKTPQQAYSEGKSTLVAGVRRTLDFESCKPSAHYQLPLATGCMGMCMYCYLNTQLGKKPYMRVYVNVDEILEKAAFYIKEREPDITYFEGAATSDPIPVEPYTGSLLQTINFFGKQTLGRFRFVTKFTDVEGILDAVHNGHTTVRFSLNSAKVIRKYEHKTASMEERVAAAQKIAGHDYPLGFIIAPVILYEGWKNDYNELLNELEDKLGKYKDRSISFEIISHRFTARAKKNINEIFPENDIPMNEQDRRFKYGQFGYGKYVYNKDELSDMEAFFRGRIAQIFPNSIIDYVI